MAKIYVASQFENRLKVRSVMYALKQHGHEITYDWTNHLYADSNDKRKKWANQDIKGIKDCDALLLLMPVGAGAHTELGAALALDIPVLLVGPVDKNRVFYNHDCVKLCRHFSDAIDHLKTISEMKR